jgi:hypothetical protein
MRKCGYSFTLYEFCIINPLEKATLALIKSKAQLSLIEVSGKRLSTISGVLSPETGIVLF